MAMLSQLRALMGAAGAGGSIPKGYAMGGTTTVRVTGIEGFNFDTETAFDPSAVLSVARTMPSGASGGLKGFAGGGENATPANVNEIDGIVFATEVASDPSATLAVARADPSGISASSTNKGYWGGGVNTSSNVVSEIDGINFAGDTAINPSAVLNNGVRRWQGSFENADKGYFGGGSDQTTQQPNIDGLTYSTEASFDIGSNLPNGNNLGARGVSSLDQDKGYWLGGMDGILGPWITQVEGLNMATDATLNPSMTISVARSQGAPVSGKLRGYMLAGQTGLGTNTTEIDGIIFSSETLTDPSAVLAVSKDRCAGVQSWPQTS
jgi:hypothetical protein